MGVGSKRGFEDLDGFLEEKGRLEGLVERMVGVEEGVGGLDGWSWGGVLEGLLSGFHDRLGVYRRDFSKWSFWVDRNSINCHMEHRFH